MAESDVNYVKRISEMSNKEWWDHIKNRPTPTQVVGAYGYDSEEGQVDNDREPEYLRRRRINKEVAKQRLNIIQMNRRGKVSRRQTKDNKEEAHKPPTTNLEEQQVLYNKKKKEAEEIKIKAALFNFQSSVLRNEAKIDTCQDRTPHKVEFPKLEGAARSKAYQQHLQQIAAEAPKWVKLREQLEARWKEEARKQE